MTSDSEKRNLLYSFMYRSLVLYFYYKQRFTVRYESTRVLFVMRAKVGTIPGVQVVSYIYVCISEPTSLTDKPSRL